LPRLLGGMPYDPALVLAADSQACRPAPSTLGVSDTVSDIPELIASSASCGRGCGSGGDAKDMSAMPDEVGAAEMAVGPPSRAKRTLGAPARSAHMETVGYRSAWPAPREASRGEDRWLFLSV
jgi:hypothetical protein